MRALLARIEPFLVPDWRQAWKWFSVHVMIINTAFVVTWSQLPYDIKAFLPQWFAVGVAGFLLVAGIVGRLVDQGDKNANDTH